MMVMSMILALAAQAAPSMTYPTYAPSAKSTWLLINSTIANPSPAVMPVLFETEAHCKVAASALGKAARCIQATVIR